MKHWNNSRSIEHSPCDFWHFLLTISSFIARYQFLHIKPYKILIAHVTATSPPLHIFAASLLVCFMLVQKTLYKSPAQYFQGYEELRTNLLTLIAEAEGSES